MVVIYPEVRAVDESIKYCPLSTRFLPVHTTTIPTSTIFIKIEYNHSCIDTKIDRHFPPRMNLVEGLPSQSFFPRGTTLVKYASPPAAGLNCSFAVFVSDQTAPTVICPEDMVGTSGKPVIYALAEAYDNIDGQTPVSLVAGPVSGSIFPSGDTQVVFSAVDKAGNEGTCSFTVTIRAAGATRSPTPAATTTGSCLGRCSGKAGDCWCDSACHNTGDCCKDFSVHCEPGTASPPVIFAPLFSSRTAAPPPLPSFLFFSILCLLLLFCRSPHLVGPDC